MPSRFFIDTSVFLHSLEGKNACRTLIEERGKEKVVTLDVIKELYRVLKRNLHGNEARIQEVLDIAREECRVAPKADANRAHEYKLRDKGDLLILAGAVREKCDYLVSEDYRLREDAKKYIKAVTAGEALKVT